MALADQANRYIDEQKPWQMIKQEGREAQVHEICTLGINLFRVLMVYLKPIIPVTVKKAEEFLDIAPLNWNAAGTPLLDHPIKRFQALMTRIDDVQIQAIIESSRPSLEESCEPSPGLLHDNPIAAQIGIEDFVKVDMRVARIIAANPVEGADKLLQLTLDLGGQQRHVFAGIKAAYDPESLIGRDTIVVANLAHRKMRFGVSEGMVLAAGPGGREIFLLSPDSGAKPGMRVT